MPGAWWSDLFHIPSPKVECYAGKKLFTPGPLGCSLSTKEAMLQDLGSRDAQFIKVFLLLLPAGQPVRHQVRLLRGC